MGGGAVSGGSYGEGGAGGGSSGGFSVGAGGGQNGIQTGGGSSGGFSFGAGGGHNRIQTGGGSNAGFSVGAGGQNGKQTGGGSSGGFNIGGGGGKWGNFNFQFGKGNGAMNTWGANSPQAGGKYGSSSWSWKSGGHGGKVNDGIAQSNSNRGGATIDNMNDNLDDGLTDDDDADSNGDNGSARNANGLELDDDDGNLSGATESSGSPEKNLSYQKIDGVDGKTDARQNDGLNSQNGGETDDATSSSNGKVAHKSTGLTDSGSQEKGKSGDTEISGNTSNKDMTNNYQKTGNNKVGRMDERGNNGGGIVREDLTGTSLMNDGNKMTSKTGTDGPLHYTVQGEIGSTSMDGVNLEDVAGINDGDAAPKLDDGKTMDKISNDGDHSIQGVTTFSHPRGRGPIDDNERVRPDDETIDGNFEGPPSTWILDKKNNISRQDGVNNGSTWTRHGNSSGTYGHKGIRKWSRMNNTMRHHRVVTDNRDGNDKRKAIIHKGKNDTGDHDGIVNGQKKDVKVHHGIQGGRRSKIHHERGKKGGNRGHHRIKN